MVGKTVAHYQIIEKIGAGGMGEVYGTKVLFGANPWFFGRIGYDVARDGEHFVINSFAETADYPILLVVNWLSELEH